MSETNSENDSGLLPFLIVGIGSSAGGVEAYIDLFDHLPSDSGMAFVVAPHLAPQEKSQLPEILAQHTQMTVAPIEQGARPEPNHVHVLTPNSSVTLEGGVFQVTARPESGKFPIDRFFQSLACDQKSRTIGVILSGMDSDGALGMRAIKAEGGISIVQAPETARYPAMPLNTIATEQVDLVVPPSEIATELTRIARQFRHLAQAPVDAPNVEEQAVTRIFGMLRAVGGVNFADYKRPAMRRRLTRRMMVKGMERLAKYSEYLREHSEEVRALHEDMLVNVAHFFRDADFCECLTTEVFAKLLPGRTAADPFRVWVAGCSTGEEVYSIGMCLLEYLSEEHGVESGIQLFGTDASESSIVKARAGVYLESLLGPVSKERRRRFFVKTDGGYQVSKRLRDLCVFARHNLSGDPPFSRIDLAICPSLLAHLDGKVKKKVWQSFHYALRTSGYFALGAPETSREFIDLFHLVDRHSKIYTKASAPVAVPVEHAESSKEDDLQKIIDRMLLTRYGPPSVVIDEHWTIVLTRGNVERFLGITPGVASLNLLRMVREGIADAVRGAVQQALDEGKPVVMEDLHLFDGLENFRLEVLPLPGKRQSRYCLLIFASETGVAAEPAAAAEAATKIYLQSLIEERDARNQELILANEEVQSVNEELATNNEELQTAKEEVQSANDELQVLNEQLQIRNAVLVQTANLSNLLNSVNMPVLMVGHDLLLRQFTPPAQRIMSLRPADIGQPIQNIRTQLSIENLAPLMSDVLETLAPKEFEVQDRTGRWYLMRIRPYRTSENKIEGAVMMLIDIEESRRAQKELRDSMEFARRVIEGVPIPLVVLDLDLKIRTANNAFRTLSGVQGDGLEMRSFPEIARMVWGMQFVGGRLEALRDQPPGANFQLRWDVTHPELKFISIQALVMQANSQKVLLLVLEDVTMQRRGERAMVEENAVLEGRVLSTQQTLGRTQEELRGLAAKLFTSQEDERRRVARELHDDVTQKLALLEIQVTNAMQSNDIGESRARLQPLQAQIGQLCEDVRKLSHDLHPSVLETLGLGEALKNLIQEFGEREGMLTTFQRHQVPEQIPRTVAACLYRIAQEALRNVAKHAGKTHVKVALEGTEGGVRLEVRDLGMGFDAAGSELGLGLVSMVERARLVGGVVSVQSNLGRGTLVTIDVPVPIC